MNLRPSKREEPDVNLTPLIDVVFLLLIFFMVSTTFKKESQLEVELPEASQSTEAGDEKMLELVIDAQGRYMLNDVLMSDASRASLQAALSREADGDLDLAVSIRADGQTPHQAVVTAMDAAGRAGLTRISIPTTQAVGE